jgi:hypothetical protein
MFPFPKKKMKRPDALLVVRRLFVLREVFAKALATPPAEHIEQWMKNWSQEDCRQFTSDCGAMFAAREEQIRSLGLWADMSEDERKFIRTGVMETTDRHRIDASWLVESMVCLLWSLGRVERLPGYDEETTHELIEEHTGRSSWELLKTATLRPQQEIEEQRGLAELWHWRCRTRKLLEAGLIPAALENGLTMEKVIEMSAAKAAEAHAFEAPIGNDFPTFGKPFREMDPTQFASVTSISQERHKAFNWLCGYAPGNRWAETPTDT